MENLLFEDHLYTLFVYDNTIRVRDERSGEVRDLCHSSNLRLRDVLCDVISPDCSFIPWTFNYKK